MKGNSLAMYTLECLECSVCMESSLASLACRSRCSENTPNARIRFWCVFVTILCKLKPLVLFVDVSNFSYGRMDGQFFEPISYVEYMQTTLNTIVARQIHV